MVKRTTEKDKPKEFFLSAFLLLARFISRSPVKNGKTLLAGFFILEGE